VQEPLSVLIVGAGAVGRVFARHLRSGGAEVRFLVRPAYVEHAARGFAMVPLGLWGRRSCSRLEGVDVLHALDEVVAKRFDQVYIALASPSLRGPWLRSLVEACGAATVVVLQPTHGDREIALRAGVPVERLVMGLVSFVAYEAPLSGESPYPGPMPNPLAFWFPPLSPSRFSGPDSRTNGVVEALRQGGLPAKRHKDIGRASAFPIATMMVYLTALEASDYSLRGASAREALRLGASAAREAMRIVAKTEGRAPMFVRMLASPTFLRMVLMVGGVLTPFPLLAYLKTHFTKVRAQTRATVVSLLEEGKALALPVTSLQALLSLSDGRAFEELNPHD
jgi:ketopantoate reductase